jgi:AraC-like DNA-binding protein
MAYTYIYHTPSAPLNHFIDDLYYWEGPPPYWRMKVVPIPSSHLMVNLGDPFHVYKPDQSEPFAICKESWIVGVWDTHHTVHWPAHVRFFGVHFKAGGAYPFLRQPLSELHNQIIPLETIWGYFAAELREQLYSASSIAAGFALLEQHLLSRFHEKLYGLEVVQYAITEMTRKHSTLSIKALSDHIGISQNHLGTQFKRMVGIPPKPLARLYRLAYIHRAIENLAPSPDWIEIALQAGYYDQSHFNKDFMLFSGHNPTDYLRLVQQLHLTDPDHNHQPRPLPTD